MPKRASWVPLNFGARYPKSLLGNKRNSTRDLRAIKSMYSKVNLSKELFASYELLKKMSERDESAVIDRDELMKCLETFPSKGFLAKAFKGLRGAYGVREFKNLRPDEAANLFKNKYKINQILAKHRINFDSFYRHFLTIFGQSLSENIREKAGKIVSKHLEDYLIQRGFKLDKGFFDYLARNYLKNRLGGIIEGRLDLAEFESLYVISCKAARATRIGTGSEINLMLRRAFEGRRVRGALLSTFKEIRRKAKLDFDMFNIELVKSVEKGLLEGHILFRGKTQDEINSYLAFEQEKFEERLFSRLQKYAREFPPAPKKNVAPEKNPVTPIRTESEWVARVRRQRELEKEKAASKKVGRAFDSVAYCLDRIRIEHPNEFGFFSRLIERKLISPRQFVGIFSAGPLTQRVFFAVLNNSEFVRRFGIEKAGILAGIVIDIGSTGRKKEMAPKAGAKRNANNGKRADNGVHESREIYDFLISHGYASQEHHGRRAVYFERHLPQ